MEEAVEGIDPTREELAQKLRDMSHQSIDPNLTQEERVRAEAEIQRLSYQLSWEYDDPFSDDPPSVS
jgi:hypothetical protein